MVQGFWLRPPNGVTERGGSPPSLGPLSKAT